MVATALDFFGPYTSEVWTVAQWQAYIQAVGADGVVQQLNSTSALAVTQHGAGDRSVDVAAGRILLQGWYGENSTTKNLPVNINISGSPRIDLVIAQLLVGTPAFQLDVLTGTPAGSPVAPTLTQSAATYQVALAQLAVANGFVSILTANITDQRAWGGPKAVRIPSVASAAALNVNIYTGAPSIIQVPVTGTTTITSIATAVAGTIITLEFASANCAVTSGTPILLSTTYTSTVGSTLTLYSDGTNWLELCRSLPPASSTAAVNNALANGDFSVWQRGTSFAAIANSAFLADRWAWTLVGTAANTVTQDTDVPTVASNAISQPYSMKADVTTADAAVAAGDLVGVSQNIEGFDVRALANGFSMSFWVKAVKAGTYCVSFRNQANNRSYVAEYGLSANTWTYVTITVPAFSAAGTFLYTTGIGLRVFFTLMCGSTFQTTANTWAVGNFLGTSNQVNAMDDVANNFWLTLVNIVPGATAYPLLPLPYEVQLARCQRYCQVYGGTATLEAVASGVATTTGNVDVVLPFPVTMLATPTLTVSAAADWAVIHGGGTTGPTALALTANGSSSRAARLSATAVASFVVGTGALLIANTSTVARLTFEANPA